MKTIEKILKTALILSGAIGNLPVMLPDSVLVIPEPVQVANAWIGGIAVAGLVVLPKLKEVWNL